MYKIKEFAKITGLPASTLRYYDKEGILVPSLRSLENNYRYYAESDYEKARLLAVLRQHNFAIAEIKDILLTITDFAELSYYLLEKKELLAREIITKQQQINALETLISEVEVPPVQQEYQICQQTKSSFLYLFQAYQGPYEAMGPTVKQLYQSAGSLTAGPLFMLEEATNENNPCLLGLPVNKQPADPQAATAVFHQQHGIQLTHYGSYQTIGAAYKALLDHALQQQLTVGGQLVTSFVQSPGKIFKGNPHRYQTEIFLPISDQ